MKNLSKTLVLAFSLIIMIGCGGTTLLGQKTYKTEKISVSVPKGWKAFPYYNMGSKKVLPGQVGIFKGTTKRIDLLNTPSIVINLHDDKNMSLPSESSFTDIEDIQAFELGNYEWVGFIGTNSANFRIATLKGTGENYCFLVTIIFKMGGETISMDDDDVKTIIESITAKQ